MPKDTKTLCIKKGCASVLTQPLPEGRGSHADSQLESRLPQETEDEPYLRRSEQDGFLGISRAGEFVL